MPESARDFFESLPARLDPAKTADLEASYRFDIAGAGSWRVGVSGGAVAVDESQAAADCVIQMSDETFSKLRNGRASPMTSFMTGKIKVKGDMALAAQLKALFF